MHHSILEIGNSKFSTILVARVCAALSRWVPYKIICCAFPAKKVHAGLRCFEKKLVVQNGYDLSVFKPSARARCVVRQPLHVKESEFLIGNFGCHHPFKDHYNLLSAISLVRDEAIPFVCVLFGTGLTSDNDEVVSLVESFSLENLVVLKGQDSDMPALMNSWDLHVLSSSSEGFPNALAEATACGTLCVTTQVGDAVCVVGDSSLSHPPQDAISLARLIVSMYEIWRNQPDNWHSLRETSIVRIVDKFSIGAMVVGCRRPWEGI